MGYRVNPPGFSDRAFRRIRKGMTEAEVLPTLPPPLGEVCSYDDGLLGAFTGAVLILWTGSCPALPSYGWERPSGHRARAWHTAGEDTRVCTSTDRRELSRPGYRAA